MFKCPLSGKRFKDMEAVYRNMEKNYSDSIPKDMSASQYFYFLKTNRAHGSCIVCKDDTDWNLSTKKYHRFCTKKICKDKYREEFKKRMIGRHGKIHLLNDPKHQIKMLKNRKISGSYEWSNGNKVDYTGTYELDFLKFLDIFLEFDSNDIMAPSPHVYYYMFAGEQKFYIPDFFIPSLNLEVEIKEGGKNPNTHHKIQDVDKVKEKMKDKVLMSQKEFNYIKITDKDYKPMMDFLLDAKSNFRENDKRPIFILGESFMKDLDIDIMNGDMSIEEYDDEPLLESKGESVTNFPFKGDNKEVSLSNSTHPEFDYNYAVNLKKNYPGIWDKGGNIYGNTAYSFWVQSKQGKIDDNVLAWIRKREAWGARHKVDIRLAGIIANVKWGTIVSKGEKYMKDVIEEAIDKINKKKNVKESIDNMMDSIDESMKDINFIRDYPNLIPTASTELSQGHRFVASYVKKHKEKNKGFFSDHELSPLANAIRYEKPDKGNLVLVKDDESDGVYHLETKRRIPKGTQLKVDIKDYYIHFKDYDEFKPSDSNISEEDIEGFEESTTDEIIDYEKCDRNIYKPNIIENPDINTLLDNAKRILLSSDYHLFEMDKGSSVNPTLTTEAIIQEHNNMMRHGDVSIILGDLADGEMLDKDELYRHVIRLSGPKVLILGNNDCLPESFYKECGFDHVVEGLKWRNVIFTHVPINVKYDVCNVHGHIHSENDYYYITPSYHLKVYTKENKNRPIVLELSKLTKRWRLKK